MTDAQENAPPGQGRGVESTHAGQAEGFGNHTRLNLARGSRAADVAVVPWAPTWGEFVAGLAAPTVGDKDGPYFLRGACEGKRGNEAMTGARDLLLVIDGDTRMDPATGGEPEEVIFPGETRKDHALACCDPMAVHQALARAGLTHVLYTSHSSGKRGPDWHKWRAVITSNATPGTLEAATAALHDLLWDAGLYVWPMRESTVLAQAWFLPRVAPERASLFYSAHHEGTPFDVATLAAPAPGNLEHLPARGKAGQHDNVIGQFNDANHVPTMLEARGYRRITARRYLSPSSTTGMPGVTILADSGERHFFSHGSSDPMGDGQRHDAFDLLCMLDHGGDRKAALQAARQSLGLPEKPRRRAASITPTPASDGVQWAGAHDPCTHLANAHRLVSAFGDALLFVDGIGWHVWNPPWRHDELAAKRIAQALGKMIAKEAAAMAPWVAEAKDIREREEREGAMNRRFKWATSSENAMNIESSLRMAQPLLSCKAEHLDAAPMLLGLPSGVLELETGAHREHRQADRLTRTAGCDFIAEATCPTWKRFLSEIMGGDVDLLDYLQRLSGYALSGHRGEHLLPILYGVGANGKSTFLATLQHVLGDYASSAAPGLLIARGGNEHPTGLADLQGRRLVVVSETGEAGRLHEEQVKALTGGDRISARRMRMDFYQFAPTHLLMMQTNHKPRVAGTDEGIWRRLRLIPFTVTIPAERRDPRLPDKLKAEAPGILAWAFEGWRRYQADGFRTPDSVTAATREYRDASDQIGAFVSEACEVGEHLTAASADLYRAYANWCDEAGERPRTQREFGMRLSERGFEPDKGTGGSRRRRGLAIFEGYGVSGASGTSGGGFGLIASRAATHRAYAESTATCATTATRTGAADDYRHAKGRAR